MLHKSLAAALLLQSIISVQAIYPFLQSDTVYAAEVPVFENGYAKLEPYNPELLTAEGNYQGICPDSFLDYANISRAEFEEKIEQLPEMLAENPNEISIVSISPYDDTILVNIGTLAAIQDDRIVMFWGDVDAIENEAAANKLDKLQQSAYRQYPGKEGVVWSPDGRYFTLSNFSLSSSTAQSTDPLLFDLQTGEVSLLEETGENIVTGGCLYDGAVFSSDSRYLYYILTNGPYATEDSRSSLIRYDLMNGEKEVCLCIPNSTGTFLRPMLTELSDGSLLCMCEDPYQQSVLHIRCENGEWKETHLDLPGKSQTVSTDLLSVSESAGYGFGVNRDSKTLFRFPIDAVDTSDIDFWSLNDDVTGFMQIPVSDLPENAAMEPVTKKVTTYCVSPDGHYGLFFCISVDQENATILLTDLSTMESVVCHTDEGLPKSVFIPEAYTTYSEWRDAGIILSVGNAKGLLHFAN